MANIILYRGERIIKTGSVYCTLGLVFTTLAKAKKCIDSTLDQKEHGLY